MKQLSELEIEQIYRSTLLDGLVSGDDSACIFYHTGILDDRLNSLTDHFPENTLHAIAIKANSSPGILSYLVRKGFGLEAASMEEVQLAVAAGAPHSKIVFDSPVKTRKEILYCHKYLPGIVVNANSLEELERYPTDFSGQLGLRINPLVDSDAPNIFSVSGKASKFGVPVSKRDAIVQACLRHSQVNGLHVHVGSGIRNYESNLQAVAKMIDLAHEINLERSKAGIAEKIEFLDIGGGIAFSKTSGPHSVEDFVNRLREETGLFGEFRVITEYGKYVHTDAGFTISDIEYVLNGESDEEPNTAFIHVGADLFVRKIYSDLNIQYPWSVIRKPGERSSRVLTYNIAGPLCFSGDFMYKGIEMPELMEGDKFVIQRTGANTLSMWSHHCSRTIPKLIVV